MIDETIKKFLIGRLKTVKQAMKQISEMGEKQIFVVEDQLLIGALSDGDIRKWILSEGSLDVPVDRICNKNPIKVNRHYDL